MKQFIINIFLCIFSSVPYFLVIRSMLSTRAGVCVCWNLTPLWCSELNDWLYVCVWQPNTPEPIVTWLPSDLQFLLRASMGCLECHIWQLNIQPCRYTGEEQSERWCTGTVPLCPSFSLTATGIPSTTAVLKCTSPTFSAPPTSLCSLFTISEVSSIIKAFRFRCAEKKHLTNYV